MKPEDFPFARQSIAVIGSGIAGNSAAWALARRHSVTLYEAGSQFGGHARTVDVDLGGVRTPVDVGFIVYNQRNYPNLIRLFDALGVATEASDMSFGVSLNDRRLEYRSHPSAGAIFAQKRNALRPRFLRMGLDILTFYRQGAQLHEQFPLEQMSLRELLAAMGLSRSFAEWHIVPMAAAIWSATFDEILEFPAATFVRFFQNHGLFLLKERPQWRTVSGGSRRYVEALLADTAGEKLLNTPVDRIERLPRGVRLHARGQPPREFDQVVLACHADQALQLIDAPSEDERRVLSAFRYSDNEAVLHRDVSAMPKRRAVWSSWNYVARPGMDRAAPVPVSYWMNRLQNLDERHPLFVSLNPQHPLDDALVEQRFAFRHPIFDARAIAAQAEIGAIQGRDRLWFCGAWQSYGFHEDGCAAGLSVAAMLGAAPWPAISARDSVPEPLALAAE